MDTENSKNRVDKKDNEIIYSKSIKAGKRIYYLDVKRSRNDDLYLAITESKKRVSGTAEDAQVLYEKHKIFLYKEDFEHFTDGLADVISFISREVGEPIVPRAPYVPTDETTPKPTAEEPQMPEEDDDDSIEIAKPAEKQSKGFFGKFF